MQSGIQRALVHLYCIVRHLPESLRDRIPMSRSERQDLQHQHVQRALRNGIVQTTSMPQASLPHPSTRSPWRTYALVKHVMRGSRSTSRPLPRPCIVLAMTVAASDAARRVVVTPARPFYVVMAYACAAVGVVGFFPSYWAPLLTGTIALPPVVHLHAVVFYTWLALFVVQSHLAASRRLTRHRELGVFAVAVVTAMCFIGVATAINSIKQSVAAGFGEQALAFSVVPITGIFFFAALFAVALLNVRRPDVHRRLMLIATVSILNAAVGRLFIMAIGAPPPSASVSPPPVFVTILPGLITDLLLIPAMWHDKKRLGFVHRTYWIGGAALLASQFLRVPIGASAAWQGFAAWLTTII